jgi:hypothetical protein
MDQMSNVELNGAEFVRFESKETLGFLHDAAGILETGAIISGETLTRGSGETSREEKGLAVTGFVLYASGPVAYIVAGNSERPIPEAGRIFVPRLGFGDRDHLRMCRRLLRFCEREGLPAESRVRARRAFLSLEEELLTALEQEDYVMVRHIIDHGKVDLSGLMVVTGNNCWTCFSGGPASLWVRFDKGNWGKMPYLTWGFQARRLKFVSNVDLLLTYEFPSAAERENFVEWLQKRGASVA